MKIRITARNVMTGQGVFDMGNELSSDQYPEPFLLHLVNDAGAAELIEAKVVQPVVENKAVKRKVKKKSVKKKKKKSSSS